MRWQRSRRSTNVQDRRGVRTGPAVAGGGMGIVIIALIAMMLGVDPRVVLQGGAALVPTTAETGGAPPPGDEMGEFVSKILGDTEDVWNALFAQSGADYAEPTLVLFSGAVQSACGFTQAAVGPFYCPRDQNVYIDLSFYRDLRDRMGAPGDFAQAYVIAHEVGHHVQNLFGISDRVMAARQRAGEAEGNALSVSQELQADCFAGVWAYHAEQARDLLDESGDVEEGLTAAAAIGDDRLQRQARGYVVPESFTHGTSEQRVRWFRTGLQSGDIERCDSFQAGRL